MHFVSIVSSGLVSGSYYNGGGASDINALKTSNSTWPSVRTSQKTLRAWSKNHSVLPQYMWVAVYCGIVAVCELMFLNVENYIVRI